LIKIVCLFKRLPSITHDQFREQYESAHVKRVQKHMGHALASYERNYLPGPAGQPDNWSYDCITELVFADQAALDEFYRIAQDPEIRAELQAGDLLFLDVSATVMINFSDGNIVNTGTTAPETTA
jgi:hypothetical protein